jgi:ATP-dependent DNA helicase DinG
MFRETLAAFSRPGVCIIEAGTGTGKTLAYLLPAVISGKKTIVSTGMKNLQDQIARKDLEFIRERFDIPFTSTVLKGRESYACLKRCACLASAGTRAPEGGRPATLSVELREWLETTSTGEVSELPRRLGAERTFGTLSASRESCLGRKCVHRDRCFLQRARARAAESDIVLVNHHILMSDMALPEGSSPILPAWEAAVLDEAHLLEGTAVSCFSRTVSFRDILDACGALTKTLARCQKSPKAEGLAAGKETRSLVRSLAAEAGSLEESASRLIASLGRCSTGRDEEFCEDEALWPDESVPEERWPRDSKEAKAALGLLHSGVTALEGRASRLFPPDHEAYMPLSRKLRDAAETARFVSSPPGPGFVCTLRREADDVTVSAMPVDVAPYLRDTLFAPGRTVLLTSATMAVMGHGGERTLRLFRERLGISRDSRALVLDSPFDYEGRTRLYVPDSMPALDRSRSNGAFREALAEEIAAILGVTRGRALALFTARRQMDHVCARIREMGLPYRIMKQGEAPRAALLETFRSDVHSVLMATMSFWQGVDVPGESLSAVIIDKLPFPVPSEPLFRAREAAARREGRNPFMELSVPEMEIKLMQGLGRLLRSSSDWGLMAVLDSRLCTQGYCKRFLDHFRSGKVVRNIADVKKFFDRMEAGGQGGR